MIKQAVAALLFATATAFGQSTRTLEDYISHAKEFNTSLKQLDNKIEREKKDEKIYFRSNYLPFPYFNARAATDLLEEEKEIDISGSASISFTGYRPGRSEWQDINTIETIRAINSKKHHVAWLTREINVAFYEAINFLENKKIYLEEIDSLEAKINVFKENTYEYRQLTSMLNDAKNNLSTTKNNYNNKILKLNKIANFEDTDVILVADLTLPNKLNIDKETYLFAITKEVVDIQTFDLRQRMEQEKIKVDIANTAWLPEVFGSLSYVRDINQFANPEDQNKIAQNLYGSLNFRWKIFDWGTGSLQAEQAKLRYDDIQLELRQNQKDWRITTRQDFEEYLTSRQQIRPGIVQEKHDLYRLAQQQLLNRPEEGEIKLLKTDTESIEAYVNMKIAQAMQGGSEQFIRFVEAHKEYFQAKIEYNKHLTKTFSNLAKFYVDIGKFPKDPNHLIE